MRLIDVDELRKYIGLSERCEDCDKDKIACQYDQVFTRMDLCGWIDDMPEAVVRCKDCRHCKTYDDIPWCNRLTGTFRVEEESFCSFGRKENR